ncbi:hypothetical protein O181_003971 [Austropuccinia psidii MF-1]|uniref:Uncharacterized protein n=1 Tax=Austropuccinia psidii MF-1 TaxID=1389203 RepID=A0A9Q3BFZ8_9BASI|nr:hypothetical protein [Austropuccinia psidii MF-1]
MPQTPGNSTEFNEIWTSAPENGSQIFNMVSSNELGMEVEILAHGKNQDPPALPEGEHTFILNISNLSKTDSFFIAIIFAQPPSSQKPNLKRYDKEKTVEACEPTEDAGHNVVFFSGKVEIIYNKQFVSKNKKDSKIYGNVFQKICEAMRLLKMDMNLKSITN